MTASMLTTESIDDYREQLTRFESRDVVVISQHTLGSQIDAGLFTEVPKVGFRIQGLYCGATYNISDLDKVGHFEKGVMTIWKHGLLCGDCVWTIVDTELTKIGVAQKEDA